MTTLQEYSEYQCHYEYSKYPCHIFKITRLILNIQEYSKIPITSAFEYFEYSKYQ